MSETYTYDGAGNMLTKTDFNNFTTTYGYDQINPLLSKTPQSGTGISFTYTPTGKGATTTDPSGSTTYTYDNRDRLKIKATPEGTVNYTYDAHSNPKTIASSNTNGASVTYGYDVENRLQTVADNRLQAQGATSFTTTYNYDPANNLLSYTLPNGVVTTNTYDPLNRLATTGSTKGGSISSYTYTRFPAGNVNTLTELSGRRVTYGYDNIYRLSSEAVASDPRGNNGTIGYQYDSVGNRSQRTSTLSAVPPASYSYDANDRLTTDTYDNDGNTIFSGGISYAYDFENRLLSRGAATIVYDGDGNRVSETSAGVTTKYLVDTLNPTGYSQVLDESVNGSVTRTYTYGLSRISEDQLVGSTWTPSFYGYDGHMNVRFLSNTPGVATDTYQFDAFGNPIASSGTTANAYLYSGERFDNNLSLYHLRARYYNSLTGRFVTLDYHQGTVLNPATLHKYTYTLNNPVNASDPSGLFAVETAVKDQVIFVVDLRVVALAAAEVCVLTRTATILGVLAQGAVPVDDGLCKVKPKPTCKSEFPKLIPVGALFDYRYKSESEAFAALQGEYPEQLKNGAKRPANEGPCAVGGPYEPGWHRNVLFVEGGESAGSLVGCPCCDESTGTPIRAQRWGIR